MPGGFLTSVSKAGEALTDRALREREAPGNLPLTALALVGESQNVQHLTHRDPFSCHRIAPEKRSRKDHVAGEDPANLSSGADRHPPKWMIDMLRNG